MRLAIFVLSILAIIAVFVAFVRPWLRKQLWAKTFFDYIEPFERVLYKKSETILFARSKVVVGLLLTILTQAGSIDIKPLMPLVPDQWEGIVQVIWNALPMTITVLGLVDEKLRRDTSKPLEVVAMRTDAPPEVKEAAAQAAAATQQAVEAVKEAGAA